VCPELYDSSHRSIKNTMHSLLLFDVKEREIPVDALQRVFQSVTGFQRVRHNTPTGTPIEADYIDGQDFTTVELDAKRETISIRGTSGAALSAAWILQSHLDIPLRMVDTEYSFDLVLSSFSNIGELQTAIDKARSS
jgi:hypothetical protein